MTHTTQGCINSVDIFPKVKVKTKGSGSNIYTNQGSNNSGLHINTTLGNKVSRTRLYTDQGEGGSKSKKVTPQVGKGSGPTMYTTPGCNLYRLRA